MPHFSRRHGVGAFVHALAFASALWTLSACETPPAPAAQSPHDARAPGPDPTPRPAASEPTPPVAAPEPTPASPPAEAAQPPAVPFLHDDFEAARAQAERERKLLFVDAWAEWCHTCKSMKAFVFTEPALTPFAERVVFVALDTDKPENTAFLDRYSVSVWPSLFAIDPESKGLIGYWPGSASLAELRDFLQQSLDAQEALTQATLDPKSPVALLIQAKVSQTQGDPRRAAALYEQALARAPAQWSRKSEALHGRLWSLAQSRQIAACNRFGEKHLNEIEGSSLPAFFASVFLGCLEREPNRQRRSALREQVITRLQAIVAAPDTAMSADDREDTWRILSEAYSASGKPAAARQAQIERLKVLEAAAASAKTPLGRATFDAARADAYLTLGRGDEAVRMLETRMHELPDSYEPPARLANVLERLGQNQAALSTLEVAIRRSYGPRQLRYLAQRARLLGKLGRGPEQIETLRAEVLGYEALPGGQANAQRTEDAKRRLAAALGARGSAPAPN